MKKITLIIILIIAWRNIYSQDIRRTEDSLIITGEMVSPTESMEAMNEYNTGTDLLRQNNFAEAEECFLKAIETDSRFVDAMDHLGIVYRHLGRYDEAEKWYMRSIEINPNNIVPYINLAVVYRFQGRYEDARQKYLQAQKIDSNNPEPYFGIGQLYQIAGQFRTSIDFINIAIGIYSEMESVLLLCHALYVQGDNYYYLEEFDEALKYYKVAIIGFPDNNDILNKITEIENNQ